MGKDKKKGETFWNLAVEPERVASGLQAGSHVQAFTLAAALVQKGIPISRSSTRSPMTSRSGVPQLQAGRRCTAGTG